MVLVGSNLYENDLISFRYFKANLLQTLINGLCENYSTIFGWTDKVIQQNSYIMTLMYVYIHSLNKVNSLFEAELRGTNP